MVVMHFRKMPLWFKIMLVAAAIGVVTSPLRAHHSQSAIFDMTRKVQVNATLKKVDWLNPHIRLYFESKEASGKTESWVFESNPPAWFRRVNVNHIGWLTDEEAHRSG